MDSERRMQSEKLARAAQQAASKEHLFASQLARYAKANSLSDPALCARLHCDQDTLNRLRLCGRPDPDPSAFALDVRRIADRFGLDPSMLAGIVREVDILAVFQDLRVNPPFSSTPGGMLKAARDHDDVPSVLCEQPEGYNTESTNGDTEDDRGGG
ncbi:MAG: hypothetical protein ABI670_16055 [Chloroflexota bacterium]